MSENSKIRKYAKLFGGYGIGVFLVQGINLLLIPIFWRVLTPEDFGVIALCQTLSLFLSPVYMLGASETIQRFYYKWPEEERADNLSWFFWFIFCLTLVLTVVLDFLGARYSHLIILNVKYDPLLRMSLWSVFLSNFINFPIAISRIQQQVKIYNILLVGSFATQVALIYYFVKVENRGAEGYISGGFIASLVWFVPFVGMTLKNSRVLPRLKKFSLPLAYATPIGFAGLIDGFAVTLDRYFLDKFVPLSSIGFYNLARQFSSIINVINSVFKLVFVPYIYKINALKNNAGYMLGHISLIYAVVMTVPLVAVFTLAPEFVQLLDPSGVYIQITRYIPYFALAFYFTALTTVMGRGMDLAGNTSWTFAIPLVGILTSLLVYFYALPEYGIIGILWSVLLGTFVKSLVGIVLAVKFFPRKLYIKRLLASWVFAGLTAAALLVLTPPNVFASILLKCLLLAVLLAVQLRLVVFKNINDSLKKTSSEG